MCEEEILKLREELCLLIAQDADYSKVLKASQELDKVIAKFIHEMKVHPKKEK